MKYPEEYILRKKFTLHSRQETDIFYDVNALLTDDFYVRHVISMIPECNHYIGIATGGAIIGRLISKLKNKKFSMVKDGELKGEIPLGKYLLIDDVTTTEASLREAIGIVGQEPHEIWVCVDRRLEDKTLEVNSIFEI